MAPVTTELKVLVKAIGKGELDGLQESLKSLAATAKTRVNTNFKEVSLELKKIQKTSAQSISNLRGYRNAWRDIAEQVDVTSREFQVATRNAEKLDQQLQKIQRRGTAGGRIGGFRGAAKGVGAIAAGGVFGGVEGALGGGIGLLAGGPAGAAVGAAIGAQLGGFRQALGGVAEYGAELNKLRIALAGVTSSQDEYNRALDTIQQATQNFAIPQSIVTKQFTQLQASVSGAGGNLKDTETAFRGIVAAVRATGGSLQDVDSALTATAQVFSKGKVSAEELRQQIGERLPGAFTLFAQSIGKTPAELDDALEKGEVTLQDFLTFAKSIFEKYGETAQIIADGPEGAGDRLKVALEKLNEDVSPELQKLGAQFQNFATEAIKRLQSVFDFLGIVGREVEERIDGTASERKKNALTQTIQNLVRTDLDPFQRKFLEDEYKRLSKEIQEAEFIGPPVPTLSSLPKPKPTRKPQGRGAGAASKIKEISQAQYELEKQILQAKVEGREIDVIGFETQLKTLKVQESNMGEMAKEIAIKNILVDADEKLFKLEQLRSQQSLETFLNAQKAIQEENALYDQQKFKILETSIAVGAISEEDGKRIEKQLKINDIAAEYKVNLETATQIYERQNATIKKQEGIWKSIGDAIQTGVAGAIEAAIFEAKSLQESLSGILRSVASILIQYGTKSLLGGLFPSANGNVFEQNKIVPFARGGLVKKPTLFPMANGMGLMGEAGPEAIMPLRRGPGGRLGVEASGGGGVTVGAINITVENSGDQLTPAAQKQLAGQVQGIVLSTLANERRSGGML